MSSHDISKAKVACFALTATFVLGFWCGGGLEIFVKTIRAIFATHRLSR